MSQLLFEIDRFICYDVNIALLTPYQFSFKQIWEYLNGLNVLTSMENLYLIGFVQSLFLSALIISKKNKGLSSYVLSFFILLLGGQLFFVYSMSSGLYAAHPWIIIVDIYYWTLLGPTLLLYTKLITNNEKLPGWKYLLCFIPTVIATIGYSKYIFFDGGTFFTDPKNSNWFIIFTNYVWYYNSPLFYIITILRLRKQPRALKAYYSNSKNVDLKWLYFLSNGFAVFLFFLLFSGKIGQFFSISMPSSGNYYWHVMVLYIFGIGFYGYKQKGIFSHDSEPFILASAYTAGAVVPPASENPKIEKGKTAYKKSGLKKEETERLSKDLQELMEQEKLYLDFDLNLVSLSLKLDTTTHKLSQILNEYFGKSFFDFVNEYRIDEVKSQLLSSEKSNYKIISIAYDCGFNSKSTFYTLFKNSESMTPAEYRNKFQKQIEQDIK